MKEVVIKTVRLCVREFRIFPLIVRIMQQG
nr:MAG TPA: hypothetical protein [Caudoviricetes sp.]